MACLFLLFTGLVAAGLAAVVSHYLEGHWRWIALSVLAGWLLYAGWLGDSGTLASLSASPPSVVLILIPSLLGTLFLAFSAPGRRLALSAPVGLLIGAQSFRIVVELFIHQFWIAGMLPRMLTYQGANFDIVVGLSAPIVAWLFARGRLSIRLAVAWNVLGLLLLANIVVRAVLTTPALHALVTEVPNRALGTFPYTFVPAFMAPLALFLHVLALRALLAGRATAPAEPMRG